MTQVLGVEGVSKSYGSVTALEGVSLSVDAAEFVALLGPNGAGKTTLFQLLTGLFIADAGRILVHGTDLRRDTASALRNIGVVFQSMTLDLDLSVIANLRFHARLHGMRGNSARIRIHAELERAGLTDVALASARSLSGGNRRKLELARALLHRPNILLMDEASVGLDPASRQALLDHVHGLCKTHRIGVLWATHLVDEAEAADRVLVLNHGQLMHAERPAELLKKSGRATLAEAFLGLTS